MKNNPRTDNIPIVPRNLVVVVVVLYKEEEEEEEEGEEEKKELFSHLSLPRVLPALSNGNDVRDERWNIAG